MRDNVPHFRERERNEILPKPAPDRRPATLPTDTMPAPPVTMRMLDKRAGEMLERLATAALRCKIPEPLAVQFLQIAVMRVKRGTANACPPHDVTNCDCFEASFMDQRNERIA